MDRPEHTGDDFSVRHPKMRREDRAKIFAPFAALNGHRDKTRTRERLTTSRTELSESSIAEINDMLRKIAQKIFAKNKVKAVVTYFEEDAERKGEGRYNTVSGYVSNIDAYGNILRINDVKIKIDSICFIEEE